MGKHTTILQRKKIYLESSGGGGGSGDMAAATYDPANIAEQLVGTTASQTLTNKTLTAPVINSPTGIVKGDVGLGNVDNTSDATKNSATVTLTNKRITKRVASTADDATSVIDSDSYDEYVLTAIANATEFSITGTPTDGQTLLIRFKDAGTSKALTWTGISALGVTLPTSTVAGKWHMVGVKYFSSGTTWYAVGVSVQA
jgi:hypothetical protein